MRKTIIPLAIAAAILPSACGTGGKIGRLTDRQARAELALPPEKQVAFRQIEDDYRPMDTLLVVDIDGTPSLVMNAVREESTGEMVAHDVIRAAVVTARFRNVPERRGKIEIEYRIQVPEDMMDSDWQLRFSPRMAVAEDTIPLEEVYITGSGYRREQDRGYMRYRRFINSIVTDTAAFVDEGQLERFIERNIPALYAFKRDSSYYSDSEFRSVFGVTEGEAVEHYTFRFLINRNNRKIADREKMFRRWVKSPYATGVRLDTVVNDLQGGFVYDYVQTLAAKPSLRKVDILLSGSIYETDKRIYDIPESEPLSFYVSSISSFVMERERYLTKTVYRRHEENTACYIEFRQGKAIVEDTLSNNRTEMERIRRNIASIMENREYDLDSVVVTASGSPEGAYALNASLSRLRSRSVTDYFARYLSACADSLGRERGITYNLDESFAAEKPLKAEDIVFTARMVPENWAMLDALVRNDSRLDRRQKEEYFSHSQIKDPDLRERAMQSDSGYRYYRESLYPRTRTVRFDFFLHRKGMTAESVQTTVLDSVYMSGIQAIKDREYEKAVTILQPYGDFNTAVAYCAMDYNASALALLEEMDRSAEVNYLLAVIYSRLGRDRDAVECYLHSCSQEPSYVHRGNLDPEISALIKQYGLNSQDEDIL